MLLLLSKKTNAHSFEINSVAFSPDGIKIVSGDNKTIKVWDSGEPQSPQITSPWPKPTPLLSCLAGTLELVSEETNAHSGWISSVAFSPDGTKIVSGSADETIKVWDSGALEPSKSPLLLAKTDACWLVWQAHWCC